MQLRPAKASLRAKLRRLRCLQRYFITCAKVPHADTGSQRVAPSLVDQILSEELADAPEGFREVFEKFKSEMAQDPNVRVLPSVFGKPIDSDSPGPGRHE